MSDLRDRLRRFHGGSAPGAEGEAVRSRLARRFPVRPSDAPEIRDERIPFSHAHGRGSLAGVLAADPSLLASEARCESLGEVPPDRLVFLDTETTALGGGAGVLVFLTGVAWIEAGEIRLRQRLLVSPARERGFLAGVQEDLGRGDAFVTFCGKSFDRHRLEDRFRFHGLPPVFRGERHLDLLHPFRRNARGLPDHRLRTLEERLLGLRRVDDLPGERAPQAYFDYLAGREGEIGGVFAHNRLDVLSLVGLTALLGDANRTLPPEAPPARIRPAPLPQTP